MHVLPLCFRPSIVLMAIAQRDQSVTAGCRAVLQEIFSGHIEIEGSE